MSKNRLLHAVYGFLLPFVLTLPVRAFVSSETQSKRALYPKKPVLSEKDPSFC